MFVIFAVLAVSLSSAFAGIKFCQSVYNRTGYNPLARGMRLFSQAVLLRLKPDRKEQLIYAACRGRFTFL